MLENEFPRFRDSNINNEFEKIKRTMFEKYKGVLIMRSRKASNTEDSFYWNDTWFDTLDLAKGAVDESLKALGASLDVSMTLVSKDGEEISVGSEHLNRLHTGTSPFESFTNSQKN